jgi:hypothetical protein
MVLFDNSSEPDERESGNHLISNELSSLPEAVAAVPDSALYGDERPEEVAPELHPRDVLSAWGNEPLAGPPTISYGIRTESGGHICAITVPRVRLHPGSIFRLLVSFAHSLQGCERLSASVVQNEKRASDGVILKVCRNM